MHGTESRGRVASVGFFWFPVVGRQSGINRFVGKPGLHNDLPDKRGYG
jgi:hypothetical protein